MRVVSINRRCASGESTIGDNAIKTLVVKMLTEKPRDATRWATRDMAKATGMSQPTVSRIWKAFGRKSWAIDTLKLPRIRFSSSRCVLSLGYA